MSGPFGSSSFNHLISSGFYNNIATQSCRFDDASSSYLAFTPSSASSATDRRKVTHSFWVKRGVLGTQQTLYSANKSGGGDYYLFAFIDTDALRIVFDVDDSNFGYTTDAVFRDVSAWYNIVIIIDTTQSTDTNRAKIYVNGNLQTKTTTYSGGHVSQNFSTYVMDGDEDEVGRFAYTDGSPFDGYMSEVITTIGQNNTISEFGELKDGIWIPIEYSGSYGANGFRFEFKQTGTGTASTSTIGADTSGNTNHWTSANLSAHDSNMPDCPENNWCVLNSTINSYGTDPAISDGNLAVAGVAENYPNTFSTFAVGSGKWYYEVHNADFNDYTMIGICVADINVQQNNLYGRTGAVTYGSQGAYYNESTSQTGSDDSITDFNDDEIIGVAFDLDSGTKSVKFYNNNTLVHTQNLSSNFDNEEIVSLYVSNNTQKSIFNFGQDSSFLGLKTAQGNADGNGKGDFFYSPPSGYLALCAANLDNTTIGPLQTTQADDHFETTLYTSANPGAGGTQNITNVNFQPDWVWLKNRDGTSTEHTLYDSSRGAERHVPTNTAAAERVTSQYGYLSAFNSNGFTLTGGTTNANYVAQGTQKYVAWNWKVNGGTTTTNDASATSIGDIDSTIQADDTAGISIVLYEGTGSAGAIKHGLSAAPDVVLIFNRDQGRERTVFHTELGRLGQTYLSTTGAFSDNAGSFNDVAPTSSTFTVGTDQTTNESGQSFVAYCFTPIEGYSKFGRYTGNGNAAGTYVHLGFRPAWVMMKRNGSGGWHILDNKRAFEGNEIDVRLEADNADAEGTAGPPHTDFLSNGFRLTTSFDNMNASGEVHIYLAFAQQPFKYANAR